MEEEVDKAAEVEATDDAAGAEVEAPAPNEDIEPEMEMVNDDVEILDAPPAIFKTPGRKKTLKVKEKLDDSFLRRSKRISNKLQGFKDAESAKGTETAEEAVDDNFAPMPLAIIPPPSNEVAPHLSQDPA